MKPLLKILIHLSVVSLLFNSCCKESDEESGDIISALAITNYRDYTDYNCYHFNDTICIRDDSTFNAIFKPSSSNADCLALQLPQVDFSKNTVLVYRRSDSGRVAYHRNVKIDATNKTVTYLITLEECRCIDKCPSSSLNMVLIPKIPDDYKVMFK